MYTSDISLSIFGEGERVLRPYLTSIVVLCFVATENLRKDKNALRLNEKPEV